MGSYVSKTMVRSQGVYDVDMVVEMPKSMFQEKDYLNLRYFYKRAYYLANIAATARGLSDDLDVSFACLNDNPLLPIVAVSPRLQDGRGGRSGKSPQLETEPGHESPQAHPAYRIHIIPVAAPDLFPASKLASSKSCIRQGTPDGDQAAAAPTPFYNASLRAESTFLAYLRVLRQAEKSCPAFKDACVLGRIWLQQRGLTSSMSKGGFGHFEWAVLVALLLQTGGRKGAAAALSSSLSSTQIFKAVIQFLATKDMRSKPCVLGTVGGDDVDSMLETGPVLFDAARRLNLAFKMSPWSAMLLHQHAKWTHELLAASVADQFNPTFITKADLPLYNFDLLLRIPCPDADDCPTSPDRRGSLRDFADSVFRVLDRALGDRIQLVHIKLPAVGSWRVSSSAPSTDSRTVILGAIFDPSNMARQIDHGPAAEDKKEARKFRQFWGEKAELRRFKDGSIVETLIWTQSSPFGLCEEIMRYVLKLHLRLGHDELDFIGKRLVSLLPIEPSDAASFSAARRAFAVLEGDLKGIQDDLPLHILRVEPTASELRSASVRPPTIGTPKASLLPMDAIISFETSGKWPDNLAAIQRTKMAFLLRIAGSLRESKPGISTYVGLEDARRDIESLAFLDIVYSDGAAFRLRVHSDQEEKLLERQTRDKTLSRSAKEDGARLLSTFRRLYARLPLQNQTVSTYCTRFPALSGSIRLAKHWFSCHKLTCHLTDEFVELVVLHVFLEPYPWQAPSSPNTGFLRTLLLLSSWDWRTEPLLVDTSGEHFSATQRAAASTRLEAWRKIDPNMNHTVLFVAASFDATGTAFTTRDGKPAPSKVVAARMTTLARSACRVVREHSVDLNPAALFRPALAEYDVLIHLSTKVVRNICHGDDGEARRSAFKNLDQRTGRPLHPVPRHPATVLLGQLKATYDGPMLFFQGAETEDSVIAAIWNPQMQRRSFRPSLPCSYTPVAASGEDDDDADVVEVNREGILAEIARIGGDLIERIEVV